MSKRVQRVLFCIGTTITVISISIYTYEDNIVIGKLNTITNNVGIFDSKYWGYSYNEAKEILSFFESQESKNYYTHQFHDIDCLFSLSYSMTMIFWSCVVAKLWKEKFPFNIYVMICIILLPIATFIIDMIENLQVKGLLEAGVNRVTEEQVSKTSICTNLKFITSFLSYLILCIGISASSFVRWKHGLDSRVVRMD